MQVQRTLAELERQCNALSLTPVFGQTKDGRIKKNKKHYIAALQQHYLREMYPNGKIPYGLQEILQIESPMLCQRFWYLSSEEQEAIWRSSDWSFEEKYDGCRIIVVWDAREGFSFFGRHLSCEDFLPTRYHDKIYHQTDQRKLASMVDSFVLDTELISLNPNICTMMGNRGVITETQLQAVAALLALNSQETLRIQQQEGFPLEFRDIDVLAVNGHDTKHFPYHQRCQVRDRLVAILQQCNFPIQKTQRVSDPHAKEEFHRKILEAGGEGVVAKHRNSLYIPTESRRRDGWIKIKRSVGGSLVSEKAGDSIDAYVSGYQLGDPDAGWADYVGALYFSVILRKEDGSEGEHEICRVSSIPLEFRKQITVRGPDGQPTLASWMYKKVAEVDGQAVSARSRRLKHATIKRWRDDKSWTDCTLDEQFLSSQIL